jgi:hypothetical protein
LIQVVVELSGEEYSSVVDSHESSGLEPLTVEVSVVVKEVP